MSPAPGSSHLRFNILLFYDQDMQRATPEAFKAIALLYSRSGTGRVWTYTEPDDGALRNDDKWLAAYAHTTPTKWKRIKKEVMQFFVVHGDRIYPKYPEWIEVAYGMARPAIPAPIRSLVMQRDQFTCGYCGSQDGPFDIDHIVPIAQGGDPVSPDNLLCACASCNRSKRAMTPEQWIGGK
jgi:5-methylcytosine-specific restriction endonuclease McrA